jgi:hypothetical protein
LQEKHKAELDFRCTDWEEYVSDGVTDPCSIFPREFNLHLQCGEPKSRGSTVQGCRQRVMVPQGKPVCTHHKVEAIEADVNYCLIKVRRRVESIVAR